MGCRIVETYHTGQEQNGKVLRFDCNTIKSFALLAPLYFLFFTKTFSQRIIQYGFGFAIYFIFNVPVGRNFTTLHLLVNIMMKGLEQNPTMLHQISFFDLRNLTQILKARLN